MCSPWRILLLMGIASALVLSVSAKKKQNAKGEKDEKTATSGRKGRGFWVGGAGTGMDHGHGHGWMKLHNDKHHGHSTKLSEAYVKFHGLGEKGDRNSGGILGRLGNVLNRLGIGRGQDDDDRDSQSGGGGWGSNSNSGNGNSNNGNGGGWGSGGGGGGGPVGPVGGHSQEILTLSLASARPRPGWSAPPSMMQMQTGWSNPQMQMVVAQPTGWASQSGPLNQQSSGHSNGNGGGGGGSGGSSKGGSGGNRPVGWAAGDFQTYKPPRGSNRREKGHFQLNFPTGRPAYIQKLKPIIDLPKIALHGWRR